MQPYLLPVIRALLHLVSIFLQGHPSLEPDPSLEGVASLHQVQFVNAKSSDFET